MNYTQRKTLKQIGRSIREMREAQGMYQKDLAKIAGIDCSFLNFIEHGTTNVSVGILLKIGRILNFGVEIKPFNNKNANALDK